MKGKWNAKSVNNSWRYCGRQKTKQDKRCEGEL